MSKRTVAWLAAGVVVTLLLIPLVLLIRGWPYDAGEVSTIQVRFDGTVHDDRPVSLYFHLNRSAVEERMPVLLDLFESARSGHAASAPRSQDAAIEEFLREEAPPGKSWDYVEFEGNLYLLYRFVK